MIIENSGKKPDVHPSVFLADGVMIVGDVRIGEESSIWFNAVLRGDINEIRIGRRTNIQDLSVLHVTKDHPVHIGSGVTVGHHAVIHGATVEDFCLIGMGAILLDNVRVGSHSLVAAGSLVREGFAIPEGVLVAGTPAVVKRTLNAKERSSLEESARNYVRYAQSYHQ